MGVTLFIARKLSLSSQGHRSSPAVRVAVAAVALSVAVMMCAIAIVMGFKNEITRKVAGFNSHITLVAMEGPEGSVNDDWDSGLVTLTPTLRRIILSSPGVADVEVQASMPAILKTRDDFKGVYLKSLSGASLRNFIRDAVMEGSMPDFGKEGSEDKIMISRRVADKLKLKPGMKIDTYFILDHLMVRRLEVAGIFDSHFESYDDAFIYGSIGLIRQLAGLSPNQGTALSISVRDFNNVQDAAAGLSHNLVKAYSEGSIYRLYHTETVLQSGSAYFQWLDMLDMNVVVVIVLMTVVACVTLCSGMLIMMADKLRFIALMQALGASRRLIGRVFMLLALRIAVVGLLIGDTLGVAILLLQKHTHFLPLDPESYYIDFVPVEISRGAFLLLNAGVLLIIFGVLWLPARFGVRRAPAGTLAAE